MNIFEWLFPKKVENKVTEEVKNMSKTLSQDDFDSLANEFKLKPAHIRAIFTVEAGGKSGFLKDDPNIPVTLEEGHIFYKYLKQKGKDADDIAKRYPSICYPKWTKVFYQKGLKEYDRYLLAKTIDEESAMLATSWGMGQVMGFNYKSAGYSDVKTFVSSMYTSERDQLLAMLRFISANKKMFEALQNEDWETFARLYNGSGYKENKYDEKLKKAFDQYNSVA